MKQTNEFKKALGNIVYKTMVQAMNVPEHDNFQVISEHDETSLVYDQEYLGIERSSGIIIIQITLNEGRTLETKQAFFRQLASRLHDELAVREEDVFINLVEVKKENWSFGNGIAQYA
jgi:phenylpyruvate tautomerase PptA (4-oxalocrotonate tautomerase family)